MNTRHIAWLTGAMAALAVTACDDGPRSPDVAQRLVEIQVCGAPNDDRADCPQTQCTTANALRPAGLTQQFCAVGIFEQIVGGDVSIPRTGRDMTDEVQWISSNVNVGEIDPVTGLASALRQGSTRVIAMREGISGETQFQVTDADLLSLSIDPPVVARTAPNVITKFTCDGQFTGPAFGGSANPTVGDLTGELEWQSQQPLVATVGNNPLPGVLTSKGIMTAVAPGNTTISCAGENNDEETIRDFAPVRVCDATLRTSPPGLQLTANGQPIVGDDPLTITPGGEVELGLLGTFVNNDSNCGPINSTFTINLTESAVWDASEDGEVVSVGNAITPNFTLSKASLATVPKGRVNYVAPGVAEVSAEFEGASEAVTFIAIDATVESLTISGNQFLFAPGVYPYTAEATIRPLDDADRERLPATCNPANEDESRFLCDVTNSPGIIWTTTLGNSLPAAGVAEIFNNDGQLVVAADAAPQQVTVRANFLGAQASKPALIVPATLTSIEVNPGLVCLSSGLLDVSATQRQLQLDLLYEIQLQGEEEPRVCRVSERDGPRGNAELAFWQARATEGLGSGSDLLSLLPNLVNSLSGLLGAGPVAPESPLNECLPLLPVGVIAEGDVPSEQLLTGQPVSVSNQAGQRGLVTANIETLLGLVPLSVGTACVSASVTNTAGDVLTGQNTVLVATDLVPEVCGLLEGVTDGLLTDGIAPDLLTLLGGLVGGVEPEEPDCIELLTDLSNEMPADEGDEGATDGEASGGLLGGLLGLLTGGTR